MIDNEIFKNNVKRISDSVAESTEVLVVILNHLSSTIQDKENKKEIDHELALFRKDVIDAFVVRGHVFKSPFDNKYIFFDSHNSSFKIMQDIKDL